MFQKYKDSNVKATPIQAFRKAMVPLLNLDIMLPPIIVSPIILDELRARLND